MALVGDIQTTNKAVTEESARVDDDDPRFLRCDRPVVVSRHAVDRCDPAGFGRDFDVGAWSRWGAAVLSFRLAPVRTVHLRRETELV